MAQFFEEKTDKCYVKTTELENHQWTLKLLHADIIKKKRKRKPRLKHPPEIINHKGTNIIL